MIQRTNKKSEDDPLAGVSEGPKLDKQRSSDGMSFEATSPEIKVETKKHSKKSS